MNGFAARRPWRGLVYADVFMPDFGVGGDVSVEQVDAVLRGEIDYCDAESAKLLEAALKGHGLSYNDGTKSELTDKAAAVKAGSEGCDHDEVAIRALPSGVAKGIGFAVQAGISLLNAAVMAAADQGAVRAENGGSDRDATLRQAPSGFFECNGKHGSVVGSERAGGIHHASKGYRETRNCLSGIYGDRRANSWGRILRMRQTMKPVTLGVLCAGLLFSSRAVRAQEHEGLPAAKVTVDAGTVVNPIGPMFYGLMTEEINHSYDGGLYAEMVSNRTFRPIWSGVEGWQLVQDGDGHATMNQDKTTGPSAALPTSLRVVVKNASQEDAAGISNGGWWGMTVRSHTAYHGSIWVKTSDTTVGPLTAELVADDSGSVVAKATLNLQGADWAEYKYTLTTGEVSTVSSRNHLRLTVNHAGTVWFQLASLMPPTYHGTSNGNRIDLMEKMAAMHPKFIRLPGGNYLEGDTLKDWYDWRKTIGPLVDRPGHQAPWSYWSTDGLGLLEYLEWCEDLHAEPVLAVYAGYALKHEFVKPGKDLEPYVQAAVDEVEYVTGDVSTKWGAERAKDGHPAPFPLHYIEVGNEDWFDKSGSYDERFTQIAEALRKKYGTTYQLIATTPVKVKPEATPDVIDDHYYKSPADMFALVHHYDLAPRNGPKVFVGEWATRSGSPTPNFGDALGDAAWMTSMERNSDLIVMASYAPLLVNVNPGGMQWATDLIGYDALTSYGSPSWYAQCLFSEHLGDALVKSQIEGGGDRFFYSSTLSEKEHVLHLKLVNASNQTQAVALDLSDVKPGEAKMWTLHAGSFEATNSITRPEVIKPAESHVSVAGLAKHTMPAYTIEVIDIPVK